MRVTVELKEGEVLVALKRPEGYEDVHPELVCEDAIRPNWPEYRAFQAEEMEVQPEPGEAPSSH